MIKYITKKDQWFDEGTEAKLIDDYRDEKQPGFICGLFEGIREGRLDEEVCNFDEFEQIDDTD